ncbi:MAG TPA: transcription-repair coupling factor [Actinomycetes bacterium]|nr:transcription-repair coupling factor [Actinomycetes bacterium]
MSLAGLVDVVRHDEAIAQALATVGRTAILDISAPAAVPPFLVAGVAAALPGNLPSALPGALPGAGVVLAVTATTREAEDLTATLGSLLDPATVVEFPSWETLPHERLSPRSDTVGRRLAVLRRLAHPDPNDPGAGPIRVLVAPVRSLLQPIVSGLGDLEPVILHVGDDIDVDDVARRLVDGGYTRTDLVQQRGEFAVRGGIIDLFPAVEEHPLRVELWGDTIEEVRWFRVADQRSLEVAAHGVWAPPVRELPLTEPVRARAKALIEQFPGLADVLDQVADGIAVEGMEALAPVLADGMQLLVDVVPAGSCVVVVDPERVRRRSHDLLATSQEFLAASWANAAAGNATPIDLSSASYRDLAEIRRQALDSELSWWSIGPFSQDLGAVGDDGEVEEDPAERAAQTSSLRAAVEYRGETDRAISDIASRLRDGWLVVLVTPGHGPAERLAEQLRDADIPVRVDAAIDTSPDIGVVHVSTGSLEHGLSSEALRLLILTESDLVGQRSSTKDMRRLPSRRRASVDPLQLTPGDYVVHEQHGVGRYVEMLQREVHGSTREYLVIEYAPAKRGQPGDRLFVPTDQLDLITRYVGGEAPSLHRLGGADWAKTKGRARKAVRQIAAELIRLYSARQASPGHAFSPDTPWQSELEDAFPYVETPDQLACINEVKQDMEQPIPMDRLVCGDVGYGKTEIAVRAAFKAVQDNKQVAILVPTTLLVQQHLNTFGERLATFPVVVKALSRFQSDREANLVIEGLNDGSVDLVIGTHRLLQASTRFKDLGLVVVDEEQRFGVEHKEHLKALRTHVDVLTMSATPIPRTLEMAVSGIREMSTILTPPEERHPVLTFVGSYDEKQISAAVRRELLREGQVFYVHNRVESIDKAARRIRALVPEARIEVAHGQMSEDALERIIVDFWDKRFDVLVCTTIVESGLDISNANTLIVERSDVLGLSQLHQLRGRVGRGRDRGYAYFLYPAERPLTEAAHDRLATIAQHTDLGSGMAIAMKDLEIRGAGNVLGGEQSGHVEGVGFDLYVRLVGEAVAQLKGEISGQPVAEPVEVNVELPVDAHIPHRWIPSERVRMEAYQRLAEATDVAALALVRDELVDRFGALPVPVERLFDVAGFRALIRSVGLHEVVVQGAKIRFAPVELKESQSLRLMRRYPGTVIKPAVRTILVPRPSTARVGGEPLRDADLLAWATELVQAVWEPHSREESD